MQDTSPNRGASNSAPAASPGLPRIPWPALLGALALATLAGCGDKDQYSSRDFNELIPRIMTPLKNTNATEAARNLFNVTSPDERRDAIAWLQTQKYGHEPPYMNAYKVLTTDPHPMVRAQAMRALGSSHDYAIVPFLVTGLEDADISVRRDAAWGLQTTYTDDALKALVLCVQKDEDDQVRINATKALKWSKDPKAIHTLIGALDDPNTAAQRNAHESLKFITGQGLPINGKEWMAWYHQTYEKPAATQNTG